jgi:hypothetical protein
LTIFDGGSNVVASGEFLESRYPWMTRIHGSEHVISLIIGEICKIPEVATMNSQRSDMFNHVMNISKVKAMLDVESKKFNNGRALTLMRPSPTRLAGELIANHKALLL